MAGLTIPEKQVKRTTKRIGQERVTERDREVQAYLALPLMEKVRSPPSISPWTWRSSRWTVGGCRSSTAVMYKARSSEDEAQTQGTGLADEQDEEEEPRHGHWREDKIGVLMTMTSEVSATDPCPEIPEHFVDPTRILKLVRQIKSGVPVAERDESGATEEAADLERDAEDTWTPHPELRTTVATRAAGQAVQGDLGPSGLGFGLRDREAKGVRGRWGRGHLDDAQAVVQRLRGDPGLYPRPVVHLRGGDGREIVRRRLEDVRRLDSRDLEWPGRAGDECLGGAASGVGAGDRKTYRRPARARSWQRPWATCRRTRIGCVTTPIGEGDCPDELPRGIDGQAFSIGG